MNNEIINERITTLYKDSLEEDVATSDALCYAVEESPEAILSLLNPELSDEATLELVKSLRTQNYEVFKEQNQDSAGRTIIGESWGE